MRINLLSDLHLEFAKFDLVPTDADVIVLAGDIGSGVLGMEWAATLEKPVVYVAGNHEYYGKRWIKHINDLREAAVRTSNVHFLENESWVYQGVRFLGATLWTDFMLFGESRMQDTIVAASQSMSDYYQIKRETSQHKITPYHTLNAHRVSVAWLESMLEEPFDGTTVVVTHHLPTGQMLHPMFQPNLPQLRYDPLSAAYASNLEDLIKPPVSLWISGHTHYSHGMTFNGITLLSNCRGYPAEEGDRRSRYDRFNPSLIREV